MGHCQINRQEFLKKAKEKYSKEKAAVYYFKNKKIVKKSIKNLSGEEKNKTEVYQRKRYQQLISAQKRNITK